MSGQFTIWEKYFVYFGESVTFAKRNDITRSFNMWSGTFLFTYHGIPLFKGCPMIAHLKPLADKILSKSNSWHGKLLSMGGCICLVNYVISCMFIGGRLGF